MSKQTELDEAVSHFNQALDYAKLGQLSEAIAQFVKAIALNPLFAKAYLYRGYTYYDRAFAERVRNAQGLGIINPKDLELAIADYSKAIELGENGGNVYYERGMTYARLKDAIRMAGATLINGRWQSEAAAGERNYEQSAWDDLNQAITLQPDIALAYYERGLINTGRNRNAAISDYSKAIKLNPNHASAYYNRALMYMREQSDRMKAIADLETVLRVSRDPSLIGDTEGLLKDLRGNGFSNLLH